MLPEGGGVCYSPYSHTHTHHPPSREKKPHPGLFTGTEGQTHFTHGRVTIKPPSDPLPSILLLCSSSIRRGGLNCLIFSYNSPLSLCVSVPPCPPHSPRQHKKMEGRRRRRGAQQPAHTHLFLPAPFSIITLPVRTGSVGP